MPPVGSLQHEDISVNDPRWRCYPVDEVTSAARAGYYLFKAFEWIRTSLPPVPPIEP